VVELEETGAFDGLGLPVVIGGCRLTALPAVRRAAARGVGRARLSTGCGLVEGGGAVDVSDAFAGLSLAGEPAASVLARLVPIDLAGLPPGGMARTLLRHVPVMVTADDAGFALLVPRSFAATALGEIVDAMRAVAAREALA